MISYTENSEQLFLRYAVDTWLKKLESKYRVYQAHKDSLESQYLGIRARQAMEYCVSSVLMDDWSEENASKFFSLTKDIPNIAAQYRLDGMRMGKSIGKAFSDTGYRVASGSISLMGEYASRFAFPDYWNAVIFTPDISWNPGEFGDAGSCFWADHGPARDALQADGRFQAALIYYVPDNELETWRKMTAEFRDSPSPSALKEAKDFLGSFGKSVARAWTIEDGNSLYLFNGYAKDHWKSSDYQTNHNSNITAKVACAVTSGLQTMIGKPYSFHYTSIENEGESSGILYINSGSGYVIQRSEYDVPDYFDLEIYVDAFYCDLCGEQASSDNLYAVIRDRNELHWCEWCADNEAFVCDNCDERHDSRYDRHQIVGSNHHVPLDYCTSCYESADVEECWWCSVNSLAGDMTTVLIEGDEDRSELFCESCASRHTDFCESCKSHVDITNDNNICPSCEKQEGS